MHLLLNGEQDSGLHLVVLDRVHGAGRPGAVLIDGAGVIYIFAAQAPGQGLAAVGAAEETAEQMNFPPLGGRARVPYQKPSYLIEHFTDDNCLVSVGDAHPILLRHRLNLMHFVAFDAVAALLQIPSIDFIRQHLVDHSGAPHGVIPHSRGNRAPFHAPVGRVAKDAVLVQVERHGPLGASLQEQGVNQLDRFGSVGINHQLVLVLAALDVSEGSKGADILAAAPFVVKYLPDLFGSLKAEVKS